MELKKDSGCFVCGMENPRGLQAKFVVDVEARAAWSRLNIPEWAQGWADTAHGGLLATLLDEACVYASRTVGSQPVTAELKIRYRKPVPVGSEVLVRGEVVSCQRRILHVRAWLELSGRVHAEAEGRVVLTEIPKGG